MDHWNLNYEICKIACYTWFTILHTTWTTITYARFSKIFMAIGLVYLQTVDTSTSDMLPKTQDVWVLNRQILSYSLHALPTHHEQQQTVSAGGNVWEWTYICTEAAWQIECVWIDCLEESWKSQLHESNSFDFTSIPPHMIFGWAVF